MLNPIPAKHHDFVERLTLRAFGACNKAFAGVGQ
jgi:hypothetical protein